MDLATLIARMREEGTLREIANDPRVQFGPPPARYIGAELLPDVIVEENYFYQDLIEFVTVIASDSTRYAPPVKKQGSRITSVFIELGEMAHAVELTPQQYDYWVKLFGNQPDEGELRFGLFIDTAVNQALAMKAEKQRWDLLTTGQTNIVLDNTTKTIAMPGVAARIATAGGTWSNAAYDPMEDIYERVQLLTDAGRRPNRIITSRSAFNKFAANPNIRTRAGRVAITQGGDLVGLSGRATLDDVNGILAADGLPQMEMYEERYRYQTADGTETARFLPENTMVIVGATGQTVELDLPADDDDGVLMNTLGFNGVGRVSGQVAPGRVIEVAAEENTVRPRVAIEGAQTSFPVIVDPLSLSVLNGIA